MITITFKEIENLWKTFRNHKSEAFIDVHLDYCVRIQDAILTDNALESLNLLNEAIHFFNTGEN